MRKILLFVFFIIPFWSWGQAPTLGSASVSARGTTTATIGLEVLTTGTPAAQKDGVVYYIQDGTDKALSAGGTTEVSNGNGSVGTKSESLTGLTAGAHYSARPFASRNNDSNAGYGTRVDFWTLDAIPTGHSGTFTSVASNTQITLTFVAANTIGADGYIILRKAGSAITGAEVTAIFTSGSAPGTSAGVTVINETDDLATNNTDTGLTNGTTYHYALVPYGRTTDDATYNYLTSATIPTQNDTPTATTPTLGSASVSARGTTTATIGLEVLTTGTPAAQKDGVVYYIQDGTDKALGAGGTTEVSNGNGSVGTKSESLTGLTAGAHYSARPFASRNNDSNAGYGTRVDFWTLDTEPNDVAALNIASVTNTQVNLSWAAPSGGADRYYLLGITNSAGNQTILNNDFANDVEDAVAASSPPQTNIGAPFSTAVSATSTSFSSLSPETEYYTGIVPFNISGINTETINYNVSNPATTTFWTLSNPPTGHSTFTGSATSSTTAKLDFQAASLLGADGYVILRRTTAFTNASQYDFLVNGANPTANPPSAGTTLVTTITNNATTTYTNTGLNAGTTYHYALVPYNYKETPIPGVDATYNYLNDDLTVPTLSVTPNNLSITAPSLSTCRGSGTYSALGNIVIAEVGSGDFPITAGNVSIVLDMPTNFKLQAGVGNVAFSGTDLSSTPPNIFVNEDNLIIVYSVGATATIDNITISGLMVQAAAAATTGNITLDVSSTASLGGVVAGTTSFAALTGTGPVDLQNLQSDYTGCGDALFNLSTDAAVTGGSAIWSMPTPGPGNFAPAAASANPTATYNPTGAETSATFRLTSQTGGCTTVFKEITVNFNDFPTTPGTITPSVTSTCSGTTGIQFQITSATPTNSYQWSITPATGWTAQSSLTTTGANTSSIIVDFAENTASDVNYTISVAATSPDGCTDPSPTQLTNYAVRRIPNVTVSPLPSSSYPSDNTTPITLTGLPAGGTWSGAGVTFSTPNYTFTPSLAGNPSTPATTNYDLIYSYTDNSCTVNKSISVEITDPSNSGIQGLGNGKFAIYDNDVNLTLSKPAAVPTNSIYLFNDPFGGCVSPKTFISNLPAAAFTQTDFTPVGNCNPATPQWAKATFRPRQSGITTVNTRQGFVIVFGSAPEGVQVYARPATPIVSSTSISLCQGDDISASDITIVSNNGASSSEPFKYRWYSANPNPTNGNLVQPDLTDLIVIDAGADGTTNATVDYSELGVSTATANTRTVWVTQVIEDDGTFDGVESLPIQVTFTVRNRPQTSDLSLTSGGTTYCDGEKLDVLEVTSGFTGGTTVAWQWSTASDFSTVITSSNVVSASNITRFIEQPTLSTGTTDYYVRQIVDGCVGDALQITVTTNAIPSTPTFTPPVDICQNETPADVTITGTTAPGASWEVSETSALLGFDGTGTGITGISFGTTGNSTIITHGTTTLSATKSYWVRQLINGCPSTATKVDFPVNTRPNQPADVTTSLVYCKDDITLSLIASGSNIAGYAWEWSTSGTAGPYFRAGSEPTGFNISNSGTNSTLTSTNALGTGDTDYWVRQVNTNGTAANNCEGLTRQITVTVNPTPTLPVISTAPTDKCDFELPDDAIVEETTYPTPTDVRWEWSLTDPAGTPTWVLTNASGNTFLGGGVFVTNTTTATDAFSRIRHLTPLTTTTSYWVREVINGCPGSDREIVFTVFPKPATPTFTPPPGICEGDTPTNLTITGVATGTTRTWKINSQADFGGTAYSVVNTASGAGSGVELVTGGANASTVNIVHNDAITTTQNYYVRQEVDGCVSDPVLVTFNVTATPAAPTANAIFSIAEYCQGAINLTLAADGVSGNTFEWSDDNTTFISADVGTITLATTVTGSQLKDTAPLNTPGAPGTNNRWVRQRTPSPATPGCVSPSTQIDFTVHPTPAAPTVPSPTTPNPICASEVPTNIAITANPSPSVSVVTFEWSTSQTDFTLGLPVGVSFDNSVADQSTLIHTIQLTTTTSYWVRQVINGCPGPSVEVKITVVPVPAPPTLVTGQTLEFCTGDDITGLSVTGVAGNTFQWSDQADFSNILETADTYAPGTASTSTPLKLYVRQLTPAGTCPSNALEVDLVINEIPSQPSIVNEPRQYCAGETLENIAAAGSDGASWEWSDREDFSSIISTEATLSNPIVLTNETSATRTITYYVRQVNNGCTSEVQTVDVNIAPVPVAPEVTNPDPFCTGTPITALTVEGEGIKWYRSSTLGDANLIGSGNSFTPSSDVVDNTAAGTSSIFVTQTINGCESTASEIRVTYNALPNAPVVTAEVVYCSGETIAPVSAVGSGITWYSDEELTTVVGTGDSFQPEVSNEVNVTTATSFYVTQTSNDCQSGAAKVDIIVNPRPIVAISGLAADYCADGTPAELIGAPAQTDGTRATFSGPGVLSVNGVNVFGPSIAGVGTHTITYEFTNANGCTDLVTREVIVKPFPEVDFTGFDSDLEYCIDDAEVTLTGLPAGGTFSGRGIVGGTTTFRPTDAEVGSHAVTYTYTDEGGCTNTKTITVNVVASPIVSFIGLNSERAYCIDNSPVQLTGQLSGSAVTDGQGTFTGTGIEGSIFNPAVAGVGTHTIRYEVTNSSGCSSFQEQDVVVNPLPIVGLTINGSEEPQEFCQSIGTVGLSPSPNGGIFTSNDGTVAFQGNNLLVSSTPIGAHEIIYTYQDPITGCSASVTRKILVNPVPNADFEFEVSCNAIQVAFKDISTLSDGSEIVKRTWDFGDNSGSTSNEISPTYQYTNRGSYNVKLTAESAAGCIEEITKEVFIGDLPESAFDFSNVCQGQDVSYIINTINVVNPDQLGKIIWDFGDGTTQEFTDRQTETSHQYAEIGTYTISLTLETEQFCTKTITQEISIFPSFLGENAVFPYTENFEDSNGGWVAKGDSSTWEWGEPAGVDIVANSTSPLAWVTNLSGFYKNNEQSFVEGPCLDLRSLERPMISLDIAIDSDEGRDGAVLQYTADDGKTWTNVGNENDPVYWYNSDNVIGIPGGQNFGEGSFAWSGRVDQNEVPAGWITARHLLDAIKDNEIIRLRLAFGADASFNSADGFGFDNIWIGERSKTALLESYTNAAQGIDFNVLPAVNNVVTSNSKDAIAVNYHVESSVGEDPFNRVNDLDPSGRALYYSISQAPSFVVDGTKLVTSANDFANTTQIEQFAEAVQDSLQARALGDLEFTVDFQIPDAALGLNTVPVQVTSNISTSDEIVIHLAAIEREITAVTAPNGQTRFEWVLRALNPSGGTSFQGVVWAPGTVQEREIEWQVSAFEDQNQIALIAFVQNNSTKEIYQSVYKKPDALPSVVLGNEELLPAALKTIELYPNPSTDKVYLLFNDDLQEEHQWVLYNNNGRRLQIGTVTKGSNGFEVDVSRYPTGLYHIQIGKEGGYVIYKKVIVEQD